MACIRLRPPIAAQPLPGSRLLQGDGEVVEIGAARALQEVAAGRGHVAQLRRGAGQQRLGEDGIALCHQRVIGEIGIRARARRCAGPRRRRLDLREREPRDVDQRWAAARHPSS